VPLPIPAIAAAAVAAGTGMAGAQTLWSTTLQRHVPADVLSRISSFDWLGSVALNPIGYAVVGPATALLGTAETLAVAAGLNALATLVGLLVPAVQALPAQPSAAGIVRGETRAVER
jgi:hypothetical protein